MQNPVHYLAHKRKGATLKHCLPPHPCPTYFFSWWACISRLHNFFHFHMLHLHCVNWWVLLESIYECALKICLTLKRSAYKGTENFLTEMSHTKLPSSRWPSFCRVILSCTRAILLRKVRPKYEVIHCNISKLVFQFCINNKSKDESRFITNKSALH
jgi:hypothetical protein